MDIIIKIIYSFILACSLLYIWHKLQNEKINFKEKKLYITLIGITFISLINYFLVNPIIKMAIITIIFMFFFRYLFKASLSKCIITPIFYQILIMVAEMIFVVSVCSILDVGSDVIIDSHFGGFVSNVSIAFISIFISNFPIVKSTYNFFIKITNKINEILLIIILITLVFIAYILGMSLYFKIDFRYLLILNSIVTLFYFGIILYTLKTKNNYIKVSDKYNTTLNSLKEYEEILDKYRISTHENKNELLTIRNLIPKNNKKVISYIDTIIENKLKDNDDIMTETSKIPNGGLRGLIYSKVLLMKENNIKYELEISKEIRTVDLIKYIDNSTMLDMCKILGVYLDNSIQAINNCNKKYIGIGMYIEGKELIISISNNYEGKINESKLDDIGYTTKHGNHGYGLSLTKQIINKNSKINNIREVSKDTFTQILKIKLQ